MMFCTRLWSDLGTCQQVLGPSTIPHQGWVFKRHKGMILTHTGVVLLKCSALDSSVLDLIMAHYAKA